LFRRLAAMIYDALLVLAILMTTIIVLVAVTGTSVPPLLVMLLAGLESFAFFCYFWIFRGQTLGMLAWSMTIQTSDGYRLTFTRALLRYLAALVSIACCGLGYLWMFVDRDKLAWPDRFSDSVILHTPRNPARKTPRGPARKPPRDPVRKSS
jgi:uncharacterized RDD family membrane protein YckC